MPRANRSLLPGHVWHITHRCHRREYLLKFARDRQHWLRWLFEARKRYDLCVLNYIVTSNHIHLLVLDRGQGEIARSMQLIAGRTAQAYNRRKKRRGAYWEDRYHATAVDTDGYLARCIVYIDMNMVRAGAVSHPEQWPASGYREIQNPPKRYRIIDVAALMGLLGICDEGALRHAHAQWVQEALEAERFEREDDWSASLAVGGHDFVTGFQSNLGAGSYRSVMSIKDGYCLREPQAPYSSHFTPGKAALTDKNMTFY